MVGRDTGRARLTCGDRLLMRDTLAALLARVLVGMMREPGATRWMCRLCGLSACGRAAGHCPIVREAHTRYG